MVDLTAEKSPAIVGRIEAESRGQPIRQLVEFEFGTAHPGLPRQWPIPGREFGRWKMPIAASAVEIDPAVPRRSACDPSMAIRQMEKPSRDADGKSARGVE